ncbi:FMN-dependent NADH-azoreductase [Acidimangrovimonas pyrenivorans]|uniref:FMN dependent NADH:quinone oxidoreductase n=1 Tax=Acidimangrovimonas pyrenivorans TaxID=2030798 RepID=A0ABV7ADD7_9RHOB
MTGSLLHVSASPHGADAHSRLTGDQLAARLCATGGLTHLRRDLAAEPPALPDRAFAEASLTAEPARSPAQRRVLEASERLIAELETASAVVIDTPMHNFTVPASLKAWIDLVVRPGRSFRTTATGKQGLLADRPVFLIASCGGRVSGPHGQADFLTPYLRHVLATIGLHDLSELALEGMLRGPDSVAAQQRAAETWITTCVDAFARRREPARDAC